MSEKPKFVKWGQAVAVTPEPTAPLTSSQVNDTPAHGAEAQKPPLQPAPVRDTQAEASPAMLSRRQSSVGERRTSLARQSAPGEAVATALTTPVASTPANVPLGEKPRDEISREYFKMPNVIFDGDGLKGASPASRLVYYRLVRQTIGHNRPTCVISVGKIAEREGLSARGVQLALAQLVGLGLIERVGVDQGNSKRSQRGTEWRVFLPKGASVESASLPAAVMKETLEKEIRKDKFEIRKIALRLRPPGGRLDLDDLRTAMAGQGIEWDDDLVAEAIGILMDE